MGDSFKMAQPKPREMTADQTSYLTAPVPAHSTFQKTWNKSYSGPQQG